MRCASPAFLPMNRAAALRQKAREMVRLITLCALCVLCGETAFADVGNEAVNKFPDTDRLKESIVVPTSLFINIENGGELRFAGTAATAVGKALATAPNPSAIRFVRINNDNTVSLLNASDFLAAIGGGASSGTVTNVSVTTANGVSGSVANPTTTPAITLTLGAITPTSVNSVVISGSSTPTLAVTGTTSVSGANTGDQTAASLGLGNVNNTSDANKPVSTAQQAALDLKTNDSTTVNGNALSSNVTVLASEVPSTTTGNIAATDVQAAIAELEAEKQAILAATWQNIAWVDAATGNNATAALGRPDKPYLTITAAETAVRLQASPLTWLIRVNPGVYTDVGLGGGYGGSYFEAGARIAANSATSIFVPTAYPFRVLGHGWFKNSGAGAIIRSSGVTGSTVSEPNWIFQADFYAYDTAQTGANEIYVNPAASSGIIEIESATAPLRFVGGAFYVRGNFLSDIVVEYGGQPYILANRISGSISIEPNAFSASTAIVKCNRLSHAGSGPVITVRSGKLALECAFISRTNTADQPVILLTGSETGELEVSGAEIRMYPTAISAAPPMRFSSGGTPKPGTYRLRNCTLLTPLDSVDPTFSDFCITATAAQTVYIEGGGGSANKPPDSNITLVGAPFTVNSSIPVNQ